MDSSQFPYYLLQFHQEANSPYLFNLEQDDVLWFERKTLFYSSFGKQIDTININKSNYTCDEGNSKAFMHCMENYYSRKLGCILPWSLNNSLKYARLNICEGKEKFEKQILNYVAKN